MIWLRANWLNVVVVLVTIGAVSGWLSSARWRGVADVHAAQADSLVGVAERSWRANASLARTIALQDSAYTADSTRWADRDAQNRARIADLTREAQLVADDLRARLDSVGTRLFAEYEATVDSIMETKDAEIADLKAERASLWEQRETLGELVAGLRTEVDDWKAVAASRTAEAAALRNADRARSILPDFGDLTKPVYVAMGAALGYGLSEITR